MISQPRNRKFEVGSFVRNKQGFISPAVRLF